MVKVIQASVRGRFVLPLLLLPVIGVSCRQSVFEEAHPTREVALSVSFARSKASLSSDRLSYKWDEGDSITVFNNTDKSFTSLKAGTLPAVIEVPDNSTALYGVTPVCAGSDGPSSVKLDIPVFQIQRAAGSLEGMYYPFAAVSAIKDGAASLTFSPLVCVIALNVYKENAANDETIESITVTPLSNTGLAGVGTVDLTAKSPSLAKGGSGSLSVSVQFPAPLALSKTPPTGMEEKRGFASQAYIVVSRQAYKSLQFDVRTSKDTTYRLTSSSSFTFDAVGNDIILTGLNLANGKVLVEVESDTEGFTTVDATADAALANPVRYQAGDQTEDRIPDFSRVGYHYGDREIPTVKEAMYIGPNMVGENLIVNGGKYADTTAYLQAMIDSVGAAGGGAIRLTNGTFNVSRILFMDYDNVVLRGTSQTGTIIISHGNFMRPAISLGKSRNWTSDYPDSCNVSGRRVSYSKLKAQGSGGSSTFGSYYIIIQYAVPWSQSYMQASNIAEEYVPVGREYVEVANPEQFAVGDRISIYRPGTDEWINDIGMNHIASNGRDDPSKASYAPVEQWQAKSFGRYWERRVVGISGKRLYLDAPIVQALDEAYGGGVVYKSSCPRITESGVENLTIKSTYDATKMKGTEYIDEAHTWIAIDVHDAEHCWIRNVDSWYMGYALVRGKSNSRCVSVLGCNSYRPVSVVSGARRYAFCLESGASLFLVSNCTMELDRHGCVTNGAVCGPNVYTKCTGTNMKTVMGPHQHWATGTLYDCIKTDSGFETQDRGNAGCGHGWTSATDVIWNIEATKIICQDVWAAENTPSLTFASTHSSGHNYAVGSIGTKNGGRNVKSDYYGNTVEDYYIDVLGLASRPDGQWYPSCEVGATASKHVTLPDATAAAKCSWWPVFTLTSFSDPLSLYQCQLEDRHSRGVNLGNL